MAEGGQRNRDADDFPLMNTSRRRAARPRETTRRSRGNVICRFNLQGRCRFGERCRNIHSGTIHPCGREQRNERSAALILEHAASEMNGRHLPSNWSQHVCHGSFFQGKQMTSQMMNEPSSSPAVSECAFSLPREKNTAVSSHLQSYADVLKCTSSSSVEECIKKDEEMELSPEQACSICYENVLEKEPISERSFGILEMCPHVFCYNCINKWMRHESEDYHNENYGRPAWRVSCPVCRMNSHFIMRSAISVDAESHNKTIADYKEACSEIHCKYYKRGKGFCWLGALCLYRHASPDDTIVVLPMPEISMPLMDTGLEFLGPFIAELQHLEPVPFVLPSLSDFPTEIDCGENVVFENIGFEHLLEAEDEYNVSFGPSLADLVGMLQE